MTVLHDFNKFWEMMRRERGSSRPPLTPAQRAAKPPVSHPIFLTHPITGRRCCTAIPATRCASTRCPSWRASEILAFLFAHQTEARFPYTFEWTEGDVLMWDNMGTIHKAHRRLRPRRAPADQALPGDGHAFLRR